MKHIYTLLFLLFTTAGALAQNPYYDAIELRRFISPETNKFDATDEANLQTIGNILGAYYPGTTSFADIRDRIETGTENENPFLSKYLPNSGDAAIGLANLGGFGSTNVTALADGLSKFMIERAKQELLISFFNNLKDTNKNPEFAILFPHSKLLVDNFEGWEYSNIINTLREAFNKDLKELMGNIPQLRKLTRDNQDYDPKVRERVNMMIDFFNSDNGRYFSSALYIGNGFTTNQKIPDILHNISGTEYLGGVTTLTPDAKSTIKLLDIVSYSVKSREYGSHYIAPAEITALLSDPITRDLYFGLLYQQLKNEKVIIGTIDVADYLADNASNLAKTEIFIKDLIAEANQIKLAYDRLAAAKKLGETDLAPYWGAVFENTNSFFQTTIHLEIIHPSFRFPDVVRTTLNYSTTTLTIAQEISAENYSAAINSLLAFMSQQYGSVVDNSAFKAFFVKYGSFAANIVQAKNGDDVEKAIESVALPVGSASIKRKTTYNIAVNGYLGGFYGNEYLADKASNRWAPISGVYAPIGITFSKGNFPFRNCSLSAFLSVIDLGAVASYRLEDQATEELPKLTLQNIFAPGGGLIFGLPKIPVSVGYTYQLGPELREISSTGDDLQAATSQPNHRWQFFLAVDIPLFNLYTTSKK